VRQLLEYTGSKLVEQSLKQHPAASFHNPEAKDLDTLLGARLDDFWKRTTQ